MWKKDRPRGPIHVLRRRVWGEDHKTMCPAGSAPSGIVPTAEFLHAVCSVPFLRTGLTDALRENPLPHRASFSPPINLIKKLAQGRR